MTERIPCNKKRPVLPGYVVGKKEEPWGQRLVIAVRGDYVFWVRPELFALRRWDGLGPREFAMDLGALAQQCSRRRFVTWCSGMDELRLPREKERVEFDDKAILTQDYYFEPYIP